MFMQSSVSIMASMWPLTLTLLATLAVLVDCACPDYFEPHNKTVRLLEPSTALSWHNIDLACDDQGGGRFEMLRRDFLQLSLEGVTLCRGREVPLGLYKRGLGPVVWRRTDYLRYEENEEKVERTYLTRMLPNKRRGQPTDHLIGSLDPTTGRWRLVDSATTFTCVICQRGWIDGLDRLHERPPQRPGPFRKAYTLSITKAGAEVVSVDAVIRDAVMNLQQSLGRRVEIEVVASDPGGSNRSYTLRVKSYSWMEVGDVSVALGDLFKVTEWRAMDECPTTRSGGLDWNSTWAGIVAKATMTDFRFATKLCSWRTRADGDWDAVWNDEVTYWIDRREECQAQSLDAVARRLQEFARVADHDHLTLQDLVDITANVVHLAMPEHDFYQARNNVSDLLSEALSSLFPSGDIETNASRACTGHSCAFLCAANQTTASTLLFFGSDTMPTIQDVMTPSINSARISMHLPSQHVAVHVVQGGGVNVVDSLFVPRHDFFGRNNFYAVLVHFVFPWQPGAGGIQAALTFRVDNSDVENQIARHFSVWRLGGCEESTVPCTLVNTEGFVDTFLCSELTSGERNYSKGTFLAFNGGNVVSTWPSSYIQSALDGYKHVTVDEQVLQIVANLADFIVNCTETFSQTKHFSSWLAKVHDTLEAILNGVVLSGRVVTASRRHVKVLVSDLTVNDPVIGFSLDTDAMKAITASSRNISDGSSVDLVLGGHVQQHCKQLAILAVSQVTHFYPNGSLAAYVKRKLMVVHVKVGLSSSKAESDSDVWFDIQVFEEIEEGGNGRLLVATWSEAPNDWVVSTCSKLRSTRGAKQVFRCESLEFDNHQFRGRYLVFEPVRFAEALGTTLLAVLIAAGVLSGLSLASIAGTAAFLPAWRKDVGHKILLQMTLALSFNLALGFTSGFVSVDTASVACIAVGALRHFSYLAMFAWMLVMSGLQLRRLLSMLGAKNTSYLLLKVSLFAWGVPTSAVGALLTFKINMYKSDLSDRGFCYPEGTAFTWSVQAPAATVLALNAVIFVVIVARLYGFLGWGAKVDLRRHLSERTLQMRRVRAVFFTFFLFGITWLFHLLAEQGVFKAKFVYEYLFLLTASVHVFSLSCIFVFFEKETRTEWLKILTPVRGRYLKWMVAVQSSFASKVNKT